MSGDCDVCDGRHPEGECFACTWATVFNGATPVTRILDRRDPTCAHHGDDSEWMRRVTEHAKQLGGRIRPVPEPLSTTPYSETGTRERAGEAAFEHGEPG